MNDFLLKYQLLIIVSCLLLTFIIMFSWESAYTWRPWLVPRKLRLARHAGLWIISLLLVKLLFPLLVVGAAITVHQKHIGLLNQIVGLRALPIALKIVIGVIGMDFILYAQHRIMHRIQLFWRFHRVHHMDKQLDVSTSLRFHPIEALYTMGAKVLGVAFIGALPLAVVIYEVLYHLALQFAHMNVRLKQKFDIKLRWLIVTPGMHRIHHSDIHREHNSNYGFCFSFWDKLFNSYNLIPQTGEKKLLLGLEHYRDPKFQTLENMLLIPFNIKKLRVRPKKHPKTRMQVYTKK